MNKATFVRGDLIAAFGDVASSWAFSACAIAPVSHPSHGLFNVLIGSSRLSLHDLANNDSNNENQLFRTFQEMVKSSPGSMLEIGARARSGNSYKDLFPTCQSYIGIDVLPGPGVDIVCDAHHMTSAIKQKYDYVFSISVFEHLLMPWKVALEMNAVMHDGSYAYIQSHQAWPLHEEPWDFWRFSTNAWNGLFSKHTGFEVSEVGYDLSASVVPRFGLGGPLQNLERGNTYLLSACIVRKVSAPLVSWDAQVGDVYELGYNHV